MAVPRDYIAAGYFLSRHTGARDCTGVELRRITLAHDHAQRRFFPASWTPSWCSESREERIERAAEFGIADRDLDRVIAWADQGFGSVFGAWDVFFAIDDARAAAHSFLQSAGDVELWGVGLHRSLVAEYCKASTPPPPQPGYAPTGPSGLHIAACVRPAPLAAGGVVLGHELLVADDGCAFNSPGSLHLDERATLGDAGVGPNSDGLIESFDDALVCCRLLDTRASRTHATTRWLPWLIVRYPLCAP